MNCRNSSLVEGEILGPPGCCCDFAFLAKALWRWPLCTPVDQDRTRQSLLSLQSRCLWVQHLQSKAELCYQSFIRLPSSLVLMVFADHLFGVQPATIPTTHFTVPWSFYFLFFGMIGIMTSERGESSNNAKRILEQLWYELPGRKRSYLQNEPTFRFAAVETALGWKDPLEILPGEYLLGKCWVTT